jgi:hypothetical protein
MWVLGTCVVLSGLCFAAAMPALINWMLVSGPPAEVEQLRRQIALVESQGRAPFDTQLLTSGIRLIVIGGLLGTMAFFVRGGGRGATVTAAVIVGLATAFFALNVLYSLSAGGGNPAQQAVSFCFATGVFGMLGTLMYWLVQAARNAPLVEAARRRADEHGGAPRPDPYAWDRERQRQQQERQGQIPPPGSGLTAGTGSPPTAGSPPAPPAGPPAPAPFEPPPAFQPPPFQPPPAGPAVRPRAVRRPAAAGRGRAGPVRYATRPPAETRRAPPRSARGPAPADPAHADATTRPADVRPGRPRRHGRRATRPNPSARRRSPCRVDWPQPVRRAGGRPDSPLVLGVGGPPAVPLASYRRESPDRWRRVLPPRSCLQLGRRCFLFA